MPNLLIRNGRLVTSDPRLDRAGNLLIVDGRIAPEGSAEPDAVLDADGMLIMPGFVDPHVHLREPGREDAETIATACAAALAGGYTAIAAMPNTTPCTDSPDVARRVLDAASRCGGPTVYLMPALTVNRQGREPVDADPILRASGDAVCGFTDDGSGVEDETVARRAMAFCARHGVRYVEHCEFGTISAGGVIHPCPKAEAVGLKGYPAEAEWRMIERDLRLAEETGAKVHFQHLSSATSVALVRQAKAQGLADVSTEVTPHHLTLTFRDALRGGANFKMNPPLRSEEDRQALIRGLKDGTIDMIATDHAPHGAASKALPFAEAPNGVIGLETAAAVIWTRLVATGILTPNEFVMRMTARAGAVFDMAHPERLLGGERGDVVVFDPRARWMVDPLRFRSKSRNCPFAGWELQGRVIYTIVHGEVKYRADLR